MRGTTLEWRDAPSSEQVRRLPWWPCVHYCELRQRHVVVGDCDWLHRRDRVHECEQPPDLVRLVCSKQNWVVCAVPLRPRVGGPAEFVPRSRFHIDDPVQAFPVHGACGMWGLIGTALFDWGGPNGKSAGEEATAEDGMYEWNFLL